MANPERGEGIQRPPIEPLAEWTENDTVRRIQAPPYGSSVLTLSGDTVSAYTIYPLEQSFGGEWPRRIAPNHPEQYEGLTRENVVSLLLPTGTSALFVADNRADTNNKVLLLRNIPQRRSPTGARDNVYGTLQIFIGCKWEEYLDRSDNRRFRVTDESLSRRIFLEDLANRQRITRSVNIDHRFWHRETRAEIGRLRGPFQKPPYIDQRYQDA